MGRATTSVQPPRAARTKGLSVRDPPIEKSRPKKKGVVVTYYVKIDSSNWHYGKTSLSPTRIILAPAEASRIDGDLERPTPPPSPNRDSTSMFTRIKPYVVEEPRVFRRPADAAKFTAMVAKGKYASPLLWVDSVDLEKLNMYDRVRSMLSMSGLVCIFCQDPGCYSDLMMEFIASFCPSTKTVEDQRLVNSWSFQMGGQIWDVEGDVLRDWFRFPRDGKMVEFDSAEIRDFWKRISGEDYRQREHKSTSIRIPHWKLIHRFISSVFFVRASAGRFVTRIELRLMMMVDRQIRVDWLDVLTRGLEDNAKLDVRNQAVGGGSFISWIAQKLSFTFEGLEAQRERLHLAKMRSCHILGRGLVFKNAAEESSNDSSESEEEPAPRPAAQPSDIPSSSAQPPPPAPSALEQKLDTLLALAQEQKVFQEFVMDHLRWSERTLTTIVTHLDLQSKVDSPPAHPSEPRPPAQSSKGKEKVIASPSTGSEERMAEYMTQIHAEVAEPFVDDEESLAPSRDDEAENSSEDDEDDSSDDDEGDSGDMVDVDALIGRVTGETVATASPSSTTPSATTHSSASPSTRSTTPTA